jgi:hypothetical protein
VNGKAPLAVSSSVRFQIVKARFGPRGAHRLRRADGSSHRAKRAILASCPLGLPVLGNRTEVITSAKLFVGQKMSNGQLTYCAASTQFVEMLKKPVIAKSSEIITVELPAIKILQVCNMTDIRKMNIVVNADFFVFSPDVADPSVMRTLSGVSLPGSEENIQEIAKDLNIENIGKISTAEIEGPLIFPLIRPLIILQNRTTVFKYLWQSLRGNDST